MTDSYRKISRADWAPGDGQQINGDVIQLGALLRIADATESMAKRHDELVRDKERAESSRKYWQALAESRERSLSASKGQITKLKKLLAAKAVA